MSTLLIIVISLLLLPLAVYLAFYLFKGFAFVVRRVLGFIGGEVTDLLRLLGVLCTVPVLSLLVVANIVLGRWSAASHFGRAITDELRTAGAAVYRVLAGHPAALLCLTPLTEGLERRLPDIVAAAPGPDRPSRRVGTFEGYQIVGSLPSGGSGGKLYVAVPDERKAAALARRGLTGVDRVVVKVFSLTEGSSLPQIVRESRSLDAARNLGLVLEHELSSERFHYVMRYAPGESLTRLTQRMHAATGSRGLSQADLRRSLGYIRDLLATLERYHAGGLWHKDVKPDNIIVDGDRAQLVDFGLITHLRSAMTLTTHGTEYFRDPEMVRMALRGVKVNEVEGERFDVYAAGAVLFSVIENSFPAHGGLSQVTQPCPEAARWIIRRAMADYDKRYPSAGAMLADVEALLAADDPFALKPAELPSMRGHASTAAAAAEDSPSAAPHAAHAQAGGPKPPPASPAGAAQAGGSASQRPIRLRVTNWWTGAFSVEHAPVQAPDRAVPVDVAAPSPRVVRAATPGAPRRPAAEQLASARARAKEAQRRAHGRSRGRPAGHGANGARAAGLARTSGGDGGGGALGIALASLIVLAPVVGVAVLVVGLASDAPVQVATPAPPAPPQSSADQRPSWGEGSSLSLSTGSAVVDRALRVIRKLEPGKPMDGTLLVVRDAMALRPELGGPIEARLAALRQAGVTVLDTHDFAQGDGDRVTELLADLRRTMGLSDLSSRRGRALLDAWLARDNGVHGVYWILPDEHDATGAHALLAFRGEHGERMARAIEHLP